jgi:hypothetical protein
MPQLHLPMFHWRLRNGINAQGELLRNLQVLAIPGIVFERKLGKGANGSVFLARHSIGPSRSRCAAAMAGKTVQGIRAGLDRVLADESAESMWQAVRRDPAKLHAEMQARWDQHIASMTTEV